MIGKYHLTPKSSNAKTGKIAVSTSTCSTCPSVCPFNHANSGGCYADAGPLALHWRKVSDGTRGDAWADFLDKVRALAAGTTFRHNQAGDLPGESDAIDAAALRSLSSACSSLQAFTYTHKAVIDTDGVDAETVERNADAVRDANRSDGIVVNLSANNLEHADALYDSGIGPVATVLPSDQTANTATPKGRRVVVCPAAVRDNVTCASCGLCAVRDRSVIVGFPAHGSGARKASAVANGEES